jgi:unsaturated chondroitin disaccharide hydrolase
LERAYTQTVQKVTAIAPEIGAAFPQAVDTATGLYNREKPRYWTAGFWGGLLWLAYRENGEHRLFELACEIEERLDAPLNEFIRLHHDVGFMWLPTAVEHFLATGCPASRIRGLKAASLLASRFNLAGRFIRAWETRENCEGWAIIDCLMNLSLLYWASKAAGDPRFRQIACAHADTVLEHFVRADATVPHIIGFDPETGKRVGVMPGQGKALDSVWARGQAWAIYGFALSYRETGRLPYQQAAARIADRFFENLPEDKIPYWDFCASGGEREARDASAACIAASGMLELASGGLERFAGYARRILESLDKNYACYDHTSQGIIRGSTGNYTAGKWINTSLIYGDFFYLEALGKLLGKPGIF